MGNFFSRNGENNASRAEILELQKRLATLENLDQDGDGKVSKREFELWRAEQNSHLQEFKDKIRAEEQLKYSQESLEKDIKIEQLEKELKILSRLNRELERDFNQKRQQILERYQAHKQGKDNGDKSDECQEDSGSLELLSEEQIKKFVEELLTDENVNIEYLPDWVERKLYINIFNILIGLLKKTVKSTSIQFIGHQIYLDMKPEKIEKID